MRLAYVLPRYGSEVLGGAETLARSVVEQLVQRGHYVEVWTTCVRTIYTWANEYPAGPEHLNGVPVHRFPVEPGSYFNLLAEPLDYDSQYQWVDGLPHSPRLYAHIMAKGYLFDFLVFMPYAVGTTLYGANIYPEKSIIWPCVHDELPIYLEPTRNLLAGVAGLILNTRAEREFLERELCIQQRRTAVIGMGFDVSAGQSAVSRRRYPRAVHPFFVYAGRLEAGKNVDLLIEYFIRYQSRRRRKLNLVLLGDGPLATTDHSAIAWLGYVDELSKHDVLAAATFLCQPSLNESFAIVLMESWSQRRPVLVHERCSVTVDHVRQSQGGLYFADYSDFEGAVEYFLTHPDQADQMGANGYNYVHCNYSWQAIINRLEQVLEDWLEQNG